MLKHGFWGGTIYILKLLKQLLCTESNVNDSETLKACEEALLKQGTPPWWSPRTRALAKESTVAGPIDGSCGALRPADLSMACHPKRCTRRPAPAASLLWLSPSPVAAAATRCSAHGPPEPLPRSTAFAWRLEAKMRNTTACPRRSPPIPLKPSLKRSN